MEPYHKKKIENKCVLITQPLHETKLNNLKTSKYFNNESSFIRSALSCYRGNQTMSTRTESLTVIDNNNHSGNTISSKNRKNSLLLDKELIKYAEPRSTAKQSYKLEPKQFEENVESDSDDDINENLPVYNKNKSLGQVASRNNDSFNSKLTHDKLNTTDIDQLEIKIPDDITFNFFLSIDKLYQDLTKDIEINKMEIPQNKLSIIKDFFTIMNDKDYKAFQIFDCPFLNNVQKVCRENYIQEIIFVCILFLINNIKKDKDQYLAGVKNCIFYFHQNSLICLFVIITKSKGIMNSNEDYIKCNRKIEENKTWLNKNNYKKCITSNNKIIKGIMKNIIKQMKQSGGLFNDDQLNMLSSTIKGIKKVIIEGVLHELYNDIVLKELNANKNNTVSNEEIQAKPSVPYLSENTSNKEYTLVLDLDETLVHFIEDAESAYIQIRPGAEDFIEELAEYFELVVFTAAMQSYADLVIDGIDPKQKISGRLYRQHTETIGSVNVKDLSKIGRDLNKVVILENCADNFRLQPLNGIQIKDFEGDENDEELDILKVELIKLVNDHPLDIREYLTKITIPMKNRYQNTKKEIKEEDTE